jgi:hypothetical protein
MGNYVFETKPLIDALHEDSASPASSHDFGKEILPSLTARRQAIYAYDFQTNRIPGEPTDQPIYWRDVGTIDAYWEANMDLHAVRPSLNLYNRQWPLRSGSFPDPPAKFIFDEFPLRSGTSRQVGFSVGLFILQSLNPSLSAWVPDVPTVSGPPVPASPARFRLRELASNAMFPSSNCSSCRASVGPSTALRETGSVRRSRYDAASA